MSPRSYCSRCCYPSSTCICFVLKSVSYHTKLVVLQHPTEQTNAKNTARLIPLVIPETKVFVGEAPEDFEHVKQSYAGRADAAVLFPAPTASVLSADAEMKKKSIKHLILLDGTWRKAKKIWSLNPWLREMRIFKLGDTGPGSYHIRKSTQPDGVSTLEALAYALEVIESANTEPLIEAFDAMQSHWDRYQQH